MPEPLRIAFREALEEIEQKVIRLFAMVSESLAAATDTFLAGDRALARKVVDRDQLIDELDADIQQLVERNLLLQSPVANDLRFLLTVLRIVPELERSGDLAEHIASRAAEGLGNELPPKLRGIVQQMGTITSQMWRASADAFVDRDPDAADRLNEIDEPLNALKRELYERLGSGEVSFSAAVEMALVGRFYERLGDHAKHIARRTRYLAIGA
ncbi:MAG: phosphate signaling complex protein PhoU [Acidimicrobiales bacterium]